MWTAHQIHTVKGKKDSRILKIVIINVKCKQYQDPKATPSADKKKVVEILIHIVVTLYDKFNILRILTDI